VQFELDFNDSTNRQFFTVQLASLEHMPVSVYMFLQQVSKQLWDNTAFFINAPHVLMAKTKSVDMQTSHFAHFRREGVDHVPFEEYSDQHPHKMYTLGFSGHSNVGPDWYVNVRDNSQNHGPQGPLGSGAEPCFGEVIIGRQVIDRVRRLPGGEGALLENPVAIVTARMLNDLSDAVGGAEYLEAKEQQADLR